MAFTIDGCASTLMGMGYAFSLRDDGAVLVNQPARRDPRAADMVWYLTQHKDELRQYVRRIQPEQMQMAGEAFHLSGIPPDEALALGEAIQRGEVLLVGKVIYHRPTGLYDITFIPLDL